MDQALLERGERQAWFYLYPRGWPFLLFVLTAIGTVLSVAAIEHGENQRRRLELDRDTTEISAGLQRRAAENIAFLTASAALFSSGQTIDRESFRRFSTLLHADKDDRGALGLGWAQRLPPGTAAAFEQSQGAELPGFAIYPQPRRGAVSVPVSYIEPATPLNRRAVGFDMNSDPVRRAAMEQAVRSEQPVTSGLVELIRDGSRHRTGFIIYMPVYDFSTRPKTVRGFVYSPFRADQFLASAAALFHNRDVDIEIYDGAVRPDRLLTARRQTGNDAVALERPIVLGQHEWILRVTDKRPELLSTLSRATLLFGLVLGLLVMTIARMIMRRAAEDRTVLEWLSSQAAIRTSLTRELNHRVKNTLANVLSIVSLTRRRSCNINDFADSLTGRVRALSATHDLLSQSDWSNALVGSIVRSELAPYLQDDEGHIEMTGPQISLAPNDSMSLGLAIHELATNAAKYGALSTDDGHICVKWWLETPEIARVQWIEQGGPEVRTPDKRGFGRDLIEKIVAHELQSPVDLRFEPEGVRCSLRVPVRRTADFTIRSPARPS